MFNFNNNSVKRNDFRLVIMACMLIALFIVSIPAAKADISAERDFQNCLLDGGHTSERPDGSAMCCSALTLGYCTECKDGKCKVSAASTVKGEDPVKKDRFIAPSANPVGPAVSKKPAQSKIPSSGIKPIKGYTPISKNKATRKK
ncbi:MAG: hypothetical protein K6L75_03950 [Cellvibrionaceae bacterium]